MCQFLMPFETSNLQEAGNTSFTKKVMNWYLEDQHKSDLLELAKSSVRFTTELIGKKKKRKRKEEQIKAESLAFQKKTRCS